MGGEAPFPCECGKPKCYRKGRGFPQLYQGCFSSIIAAAHADSHEDYVTSERNSDGTI